MTVPHITQKHWNDANRAESVYATYSDICNKAIEIALAEQANELPLITADEARILGAGAEHYHPVYDRWIKCDLLENFPTRFFDGEVIKYRAVKQPEPVEDDAGFLKRFKENIKADVDRSLSPEPAQPHAELKALYAQQVQDGTLEDFVWEVDRKDYGDSYRILDTPSERPAWSEGYTYRCTPKPTCHIQSLDTGELKTMTQEAAKLLRAELGGTVEWFDADGCSAPPACVMELISEKSYTYKIKTKSLKQVWTGSREDVIALLNELGVTK